MARTDGWVYPDGWKHAKDSTCALGLCKKAPHGKEGGYLHSEDDDSPYDVDGCYYCGRCHHAIDTTAPAPGKEGGDRG